ncbi:hypothetical protein D1007_34896 [Hordeum vulgare]|nr:hypothetical protein D1007_34896 [Hordeum vulgare]
MQPGPSSNGRGRGGGLGRAAFVLERVGRPRGRTPCGHLRRSLTTAETDAHRLRCKNANSLRLAIQLSECEAAKGAATKAKVVCHTKGQDRMLHRLFGMRGSSDEDDNDISTFGSDDDDENAPQHVDV